MAPHADVVDLTLSDNESPINSPQTRTGSQSNSGRTSKVDYLKAPPKFKPANLSTSQRQRQSFPNQIELSPDNSPNSSTRPRNSVKGLADQVSREATAKINNERRNNPANGSSQDSSRTSKDLQKPVLNINSDTDQSTSRPQFKMPRSFDEVDGRCSPDKQTLGSPFESGSRKRQKRPREHDSPLDKAQQSKRPRTEGTPSNHDSSRDASKASVPARHSSQTASSTKQKFPTIDLTSSPGNKPQQRSSQLFDQDRSSSQARRATSSTHGATDESPITPKRKPESFNTKITRPLSPKAMSSQRTPDEATTPSRTHGRSSQSGSLRGERRSGTDSAFTNGNKRPSPKKVAESRLSQRDVASTLRDSPKPHSQARQVPNDSPHSLERQTSPHKGQSKLPQDRDASAQTSKEGQRKYRLESSDTGTKRARRQVSPNLTPRPKPAKESSSDVDQGYVSLSSSNTGDSLENGRLATRQGLEMQPDLASPAAVRRVGDSAVMNQLGGPRAGVRNDADSASAASRSNIDTTAAEEADLQLRSEAMQGMEQEMVINVEEHPSDQTDSASITSSLKQPSVYSNLPLASQVERVFGKYVEELRSDNEYWTSVSMMRARLSKGGDDSIPQSADTTSEKPTSFVHMQPLRFTPQSKGSLSAKDDDNDHIWGYEKMKADGKPVGPSTTLVSVLYETFRTHTEDVPNYAHYVGIGNNILAPNVTNLHAWPYFSDDFDFQRAESLNDQYTIDIAARERKLLLLLQAQKYQSYVESALNDLDCSWSDVLRFLLESDPDVGEVADARRALQNRPQYCTEDFSRDSDRWKAVLGTLPPSTPEKLSRVAVLCENFQKLAKFSIWQVARMSDLASLPDKTTGSGNAQPSDNDLTCRICLRLNCPYHGEIKERPDDTESDEESSSGNSTVVAMDIIHPQKANYRSRVSFPPVLPNGSQSEEDPLLRNKKDPKYWTAKTSDPRHSRVEDCSFVHKPEEREPFYPCHHPGSSCEEADCSCYQNSIPCEKSCNCPLDCKRKFKGCSCSVERQRKGQKGGLCFEDERCACNMLGRECDPDLCGTCGVCEVLDPLHKSNDAVLYGRCRNASLQRGVPKHTLLGDSGVHGLGLYACENIQENDFVGEYKGEIITKAEADRRGAVYEYQRLSYLFSLNKTQEIDSTYFGNKVRFINHANSNKANLYPRIITVNTVHRIALYASYRIHAGQELLFDYGPKFPDEALGGKKSKKSAPHVRNANLVKGFLDVEEEEDEQGNTRAKGVSRTVGTKAAAKKPRGRKNAKGGRAAKAQRAESPTKSIDDEREQDAGQRLAAFNISDDLTSDVMDVDGGAEEDDAFEPESSEDGSSESSDDSEKSDYGDEDEEPGNSRYKSRRGGVDMGSGKLSRR